MHGQPILPDYNQIFRRATIYPSLVSLKSGEEQKFHIVMSATRLTTSYNPDQIEWAVNGIEGGNTSVGTISKDGVYKAPQNLKGIPEITITARVASADNKINMATVLYNGQKSNYKTVLNFNEKIDNLKNFKSPLSIAVEKNGKFLIADDKILRFSPDGKFEASFGEQEGDIIGHLDGLLNIATDKDGKIFASDQKITPPHIMAFNEEGKHLYSFSYKGYHPGMGFITRGMAFDSGNRLYIGDIDLQRITVFDNAGNYQYHFGTPGNRAIDFNGYYDLALDQNNDVFVANYFGRCQKLDAKGHYISSFANADPPSGIIYTTNVAVDANGNVYVVAFGEKDKNGDFTLAKDASGKKVNIFKYNNNGDFISTITLSGAEKIPVCLTIDDQNRLVVLYKNTREIGVEVLKEQP